MKKRRIFAVLMTLVMIFAMSVPAFADYYEMKRGVEICMGYHQNGTWDLYQFCEYGKPASGKGWSYDGKYTLTLNGFNDASGSVGIYNFNDVTSDFNIVLQSQNTLGNFWVENNSSESLGKLLTMNFKGSGTLNMQNGLHTGGFVLDGPTINAPSFNVTSILHLYNGKVNVNGNGFYFTVGNAAPSVKFEGGTIYSNRTDGYSSAFDVSGVIENENIINQFNENIAEMNEDYMRLVKDSVRPMNHGTIIYTEYKLQNAGKNVLKVTIGGGEAKTPPAPPVTPAKPVATSFTDVPANMYYANPIAWAVKEGITSGTSATTFSPDQKCSRAQIITFLYRAAGSPVPSADAQPFADVKAGEYYYNATLWAKEKGMATGSFFQPNADCTRAMAVDFLYKNAGSPDWLATGKFTDVAPSADYAKAVAWALDEKVTGGTSDTTFSPDQTCTRGQIATFLYKAFN